jgi:GSCFA family
MEFRTSFEITESKEKISLSSEVFTIGSCFSEVIGNQMLENKITVSANPFGTLFNPISIFKILSPNYTHADERLFVQSQARWFHHDFHSKFSASTQSELRQELNSTIQSEQSKIKNTDFLIITFGTAFIYQLKESPVYVANCHKMPSALFEKSLLSVKDICKKFALLHQELQAKNPNLKIILTVSPVRHTREGMPENQVSKSILRAACHYLVSDFENVSYFPSYEIMLDDLRDYRFYKPDMIHPNEVAETYIFEKFSQTYFDKELQNFLPIWAKISKSLAHKPFNTNTESHQKFLINLLSQLQEVSDKVDVTAEIERLKNVISS